MNGKAPAPFLKKLINYRYSSVTILAKTHSPTILVSELEITKLIIVVGPRRTSEHPVNYANTCTTANKSSQISPSPHFPIQLFKRAAAVQR
jgi:hypothetical protein